MPIKKPERGPIPLDALAYFNSKGLRPAFSFDDVWREEHNTAFTVAKIMERDILADVQTSLSKALADGVTFETWSKQTRELFDKSGWSNYLQDRPKPHRLATIYNTNMRVARVVGQWQRIQKRKRTHEFLEYNLGPSERHRPVHESWAGTILSVDNPFWSDAYPPNGFGCKCHIRQITRTEAEGSGIDTAPELELVEHVNTRTGKIVKSPLGIDPGWDYNPGKDRAKKLNEEAQRG